MANDRKSSDPKVPKFSYGVREMHERDTRERDTRMELEDAARKTKSEARGFDPYNNSGSFDRKKNWVRVGKR